ncbi:MAG: DUF4294 domain-containing protein [Bacteroidales bacterium]|nr:DUF4294 domain-containing protein [Bacteroidales bacterium]
MRKAVSLMFLLTVLTGLYGQEDTLLLREESSIKKLTDSLRNVHILQLRERNGETLPEVEIKDVYIIGSRKGSKKMTFRGYERLIYNLKKVYPYALIVRSRLGQVNYELSNIQDEKARKEYLKEVEKDVFKEYEDDVRDMTITQGKLLIKLIYRETLNTSYDLIRQYRGNFSASFWQFVAKLFGTDLKAAYDPLGEDALMEMIIQEIEAGRL